MKKILRDFHSVLNWVPLSKVKSKGLISSLDHVLNLRTFKTISCKNKDLISMKEFGNLPVENPD